MVKKKRPLTQAEIWDDSALQQSWDDAVAEYKLYHSIHARGERVEDVIRDAEVEAEDEGMSANGGDNSLLAGAAQTVNINADDMEEGELEDGAQHKSIRSEIKSESLSEAKDVDQPVQEPRPADANIEFPRAMPNPILATVEDEALKNLMMSWYYAGYYTGLYEGQRKATQEPAETRSD